ncbi:ribokinase [bacterium]|nr:MAG: ribokinase [bacterium]
MGRIVVIGSLNVDLVVQVPRLPVPGQTVTGDRLRTFSGGKGANQAVAAARLGGDVSMVGRVGGEPFGAMLLSGLQENGVDTGAVSRDPDEPSGTALILVEAGGQNTIALAPGANNAVGDADIALALNRLDRGDFLVLQLEIPLATVRRAIIGARRRGARAVLNAAPAARIEPDILKGLDVLVVNESEATAIFGIAVQDLPTAHQAVRAAAAAGVRLAVVTVGASGAVFSRGGDSRQVSAFDIEAVDATAAGDAFVGALVVALDHGLDAEEAVRFANAAGAATAAGHGAQSSLPTRDDLRRLFQVELP